MGPRFPFPVSTASRAYTPTTVRHIAYGPITVLWSLHPIRLRSLVQWTALMVKATQRGGEAGIPAPTAVDRLLKEHGACLHGN